MFSWRSCPAPCMNLSEGGGASPRHCLSSSLHPVLYVLSRLASLRALTRALIGEPLCAQLLPSYDAVVVAEDEDSAKAYCRIFAEAGEQFLCHLLAQPEQGALLMGRAVLRGAQHPVAEGAPEVVEGLPARLPRADERRAVGRARGGRSRRRTSSRCRRRRTSRTCTPATRRSP